MRFVPPLLLSFFFILSCSPDAIEDKFTLAPSGILFEQDSTLTDYLFDHGAWFGVTLPDESWGLAAPRILSDSNGYDFKGAILTGSIHVNGMEVKAIENHYYPGSLIQTAYSDDFEITIKSIFTDHQNVIMAFSFKNLTSDDAMYTIDWTYPDPDTTSNSVLTYDLTNAQIELQSYSEGFLSSEHSMKVATNSEIIKYVNIRHAFKTEEVQVWAEESLQNAFTENDRRWTDYHLRYSKLEPTKRLLASKCIQTLINNWRAPAGQLAYEGLFPSYDYRWFHGFWSWDSWKHAVALVQFEPELAKNQIRTMYHFQDEHGMIADVVYRDTLIEKHNWRDTKPPLSGWAIREVFDATKDTAFVIELLPKLTLYHQWWYTNRDHNNNGLCEYGSTDGTLVAAGWESGMDNAVRFDDAKIVQVNESAWSFNQESVDLNAYLYYEKLQLAYLSNVLENEELSITYREEAELLKQKIHSHFYDETSGYYYDVRTTSSDKIKVNGPEAWTTLWTGIATPIQAESMIEKIVSESHFNTHLPFPTLSASDPKFNPAKGYWRGPVWLDQAYFALNGMQQYGFTKESNELKEKLQSHANGLLDKGVPIRENYHPLSGEGLNAHHFSWSAAHLLMLLEEDLNGEAKNE